MLTGLSPSCPPWHLPATIQPIPPRGQDPEVYEIMDGDG